MAKHVCRCCAEAEDFIDATLMDELRKSGFIERLSGSKG